jgi:isopentenyl-diphosphate Delta-isomerase
LECGWPMIARESERIVIVDENDNAIGEEDKGKCHDGAGILHRAFLAMVFGKSGELLLSRRSERKKLWPGYWDGTIASHLFKGEDYQQATKRRLREELGLTATVIKYAFKFHYKIGYENIGTEHEICAVTIVDSVDFKSITPNNDEISEIRSIDPRRLQEEFGRQKHHYVPWLILAFSHIEGQSIAM